LGAAGPYIIEHTSWKLYSAPRFFDLIHVVNFLNASPAVGFLHGSLNKVYFIGSPGDFIFRGFIP